jgi:hypothetical protein
MRTGLPLNFGICAALAVILGSNFCNAGLSFVGNGYTILDANGGGNSYYDVSNQGNDNVTPNFSPNLNGLTIQMGQSLLIGGQVQTYPQQFGTTAWMGYKLFNGATLISENDNINLSYLQPNGNNDEWQQLASSSGINLDQGLSAGTYTLQVWFGASNGNTIYDNNNNNPNNYSATFQVIPEPVNVALAGFACLCASAGLVRVLSSRSCQPANRSSEVAILGGFPTRLRPGYLLPASAIGFSNCFSSGNN